MKARTMMALVMASVISAGLLAGCGGSSSAPAAAPAGDAGGEAVVAEDTGDAPVTFTYYTADGTNNNWDNPVAAKITEETGVTLDISYPVASTGDGSSDIALMIAEGEYPDLIYAKGSANSLYEAGALVDMTDLIEEYGPNIKKMYGEELKKLQWSADDPGIYQLSAYGAKAQVIDTGGSAQIQIAAVKENGNKYPTTIPEFEQVIKDYLAAHPTNEDGLPNLGLTLSVADWHWMITLGNPASLIGDVAPDNGQWLIDDADNYRAIYKHTTPEEHDYFKWLNRMYNEGILDPDFATQTDEDYIAKLASGRVIGLLDAQWHYNQAQQVLVHDGKLDQTYFPLPLTLRDDQKTTITMYQGLQVGWGIAITKSCKDPVRAVKFLDYICSDEGQILYNWGIEGVNYTLDENGMPVRSDEEVAASRSDPDYSKKTGIGNYVGFPYYGDGALTADGFPYRTNTRANAISAYNDAQKEILAALGAEAFIDLFPSPSEFDLPPYSALWAYQKPTELSDMEGILNDIAQVALVKLVTVPEDQYEDAWNEMIAEFEANGLKECEDAYTAFIAEKVELMK